MMGGMVKKDIFVYKKDRTYDRGAAEHQGNDGIRGIQGIISRLPERYRADRVWLFGADAHSKATEQHNMDLEQTNCDDETHQYISYYFYIIHAGHRWL